MDSMVEFPFMKTLAVLAFVLLIGCARYQPPLQSTLFLRVDAAAGSAFPVAYSEGRVWYLTAKHVVEGGTIQIPNALVEWTHPTEDIALFSAPGERVPLFRLGPPPEFGALVMAIGYPGGIEDELRASVGAYCGPGLMTAPILPGSSGGPVLRLDTGEVFGVASWIRWGPTQQGDAFPATHLAGFTPVPSDLPLPRE
jgi:S1-C subfamily serine protease